MNISKSLLIRFIFTAGLFSCKLNSEEDLDTDTTTGTSGTGTDSLTPLD